jgi:hypothetical protein
VTAPVSQDRFAESIQHAFDACWRVERAVGRNDAEFVFLSPDEEQREADLRTVALADFILPFAAAGILDENSPVADLPAPAVIRALVNDRGLSSRYMSIGCAIASADVFGHAALREELEREWSTWLTFCMHAHSRELRATLPTLPEARDAIDVLRFAPKRRIERLGPDGELLTSLVPRRTEDASEATKVEVLLDRCEVVAAHADSFRILTPLFPELLVAVWNSHPYQSEEFSTGWPFIAYFWPFSADSFRLVAEICRGIQALAQPLSIDEEDEDRETRTGAYVR